MFKGGGNSGSEIISPFKCLDKSSSANNALKVSRTCAMVRESESYEVVTFSLRVCLDDCLGEELVICG